MAAILISSAVDVQELKSQYSNFVSKNGITAAAAGIVVGLATAKYLRAATENLLLPLLDLTILGMFRLAFPKATNKVGHILFSNYGTLRLSNFISETVIWCVMMFAAFIVVRYILTPIEASDPEKNKK